MPSQARMAGTEVLRTVVGGLVRMLPLKVSTSSLGRVERLTGNSVRRLLSRSSIWRLEWCRIVWGRLMMELSLE